MTKKDDAFFNQLYTESYPLLKRYAISKIGASEAEDALQETYIQAYRNIGLLASHPNPIGWLMVTCKNILKKHLAKQEKRFGATLFGDAEDILQNIPAIDNYDPLYMEEIKKLLSDSDYFLLVKKYVEGYSIEELAKQLNITDGACKMRLKRAKKEARKKLKIFLLALLFSLCKDYIR